MNDVNTDRASSEVSGIDHRPLSEIPPGVTTKIIIVAIQKEGRGQREDGKSAQNIVKWPVLAHGRQIPTGSAMVRATAKA